MKPPWKRAVQHRPLLMSGLVLFSLIVLMLATAPAPVCAADEGQSGIAIAQQDTPSAATVEVSHTVVWAAHWRSVLGNRTRMIQITLIVVAVGIGFLMWGKHK